MNYKNGFKNNLSTDQVISWDVSFIHAVYWQLSAADLDLYTYSAAMVYYFWF